eukprot:GEMP01001843.1.p1 GENE.GEMP01001843.1~~GEMP01001843.1.p1  ORF type:complete len:796 (+),score=163.60 GEMP01001843.1:236-2623(+)
MTFTLLDTKEEISLVSLLLCAADGEMNVEFLRQNICKFSVFEPYQVFKQLQQDPLKCYLSINDLSIWLNSQPFKNAIISDEELAQVQQPYISEDKSQLAIRYEGFLKMILPRDNPMLRSLSMTRHEHGNSATITREVGYNLVRLLEQEGQMHSELMVRKRRIMDHAAHSPLKQDIINRTFRWLQSESSVPGLSHISPLGLRRLLHDTIGAFSLDQVESLFRRINVSGSGMLSFAEWESFLSTKHVDEFLTNVFLSQFSTKCPGCGVHVQREGGACSQVTCSYCRTAFPCVTNADGTLFDDEIDDYIRPTIRDAWPGKTARTSYRSATPETMPHTPCQKRDSAASPYTALDRFGADTRSTHQDYHITRSAGRAESPYLRPSSRVSDRSAGGYRQSTPLRQSVRSSPEFRPSMSAGRGISPYRSPYVSASGAAGDGASSPVSPSRFTFRSNVSTMATPRDMPKSLSPKHKSNDYKGGISDMFDKLERTSQQQGSLRDSLPIVLDVMGKQIDIDNAVNEERKTLQRLDLTPEAVFDLLDRYKKGYIADTDIWQLLHEDGSPGTVSFSGVCSLFRDQKSKQNGGFKKDAAKYLGRLSLAEIVHLICPSESDAVKFVSRDMTDEETRGVLYTLRNTCPCPGCGIRVQRSVEGCASVTCTMCYTSFRCMKIEDPTPPVSLQAWHEEKHWHVPHSSRFCIQKALKNIIELSEDTEHLRKSLFFSSSESLSTMIMDAFLQLSNDKGFFDIADVKHKMGEHGMWRSEKELDTLGKRYSEGKARISFPDFADQLRPYSAKAVTAY